VKVSEPIELLNINFYKLFPRLNKVSKYYILVIVDYFLFLIKIFVIYNTPVDIYINLGLYFKEETRTFIKSHSII
jgi:hypothetical protein